MEMKEKEKKKVEKKVVKKNKFIEKLKKFCKFYKKDILKIATIFYAATLIIFTFMIMKKLSTYDVSKVGDFSNIEKQTLNKITFIKQLFLVSFPSILITFILAFVPYLKLQFITPIVYSYITTNQMFNVFKSTSTSNNVNLMTIGSVIIILSISIMCAISFNLSKVIESNRKLKSNKAKKEKLHDDKKIEKISFDKENFELIVIVIILNIIGTIVYIA